MAKEPENLVESTDSVAVQVVQQTEPKGSAWDVVLIEQGKSKNRRFYPADVLKAAVPLFEGVKACCYRFGDELFGDAKNKHLPNAVRNQRPDGFSENVVGWFENVRYGTFIRPDGSGGEGIIGSLRILEGHEQLRRNMVDAWKSGQTKLFELSIDAKGMARPAIIDGERFNRVEKISEVLSTDIVTDAAAGGGLLRLAASTEINADDLKAFSCDALIEAIGKHRPKWLEGFSLPTDGTNKTDFCVRVLEANMKAATSVRDSIPEFESKALTEVSRAIKVLMDSIALIREGKIEESMKILQSMLPMMTPMAESSDKWDQFSYPVQKPVDPEGQPTPAQEIAMAESTTPEAEAEAKAKELKALQERETEAKAKEFKEREEKLQEREKEIRVKENTLRIDEALAKSDLHLGAKARVRASLIAKDGELTEAQIGDAIKEEVDYLASVMPAAAAAAPAAPAAPAAAAAPAAPAAAAPAAPAPAAAVPVLEAAAAAAPVVGLGGAHEDPKAQVGDGEREKWGHKWTATFDGGIDMVEGQEPIRSLHQSIGEMTGRYFSPEENAAIIMAGLRCAFPKDPTLGMERHLKRLSENWSGIAGMQSELLQEAVTTADWAVTFGDSMFKRLQKVYKGDSRNDWRRIISSMETLKDATNDFKLPRLGGVGSLEVVNQNAPYQPFADPTEESEVITPRKRGNLLQFTWEDALADKISALRRVPTMLGEATVQTIHEEVWAQIDDNPNMSDTNALISAAHLNLLSGAPALAYDAVTDARQLLKEQTQQDSGKKLGLRGKWLLTGPEKEDESIEITDSTVKVNAGEDATVRSAVNKLGIESFSTLGLGLSAAPDTKFRWYLAADRADAETIAIGFLGGRDKPEIFVQSPQDTPTSGASFEADALTFKVRLVFGVRVIDWRWLVGSLATT